MNARVIGKYPTIEGMACDVLVIGAGPAGAAAAIVAAGAGAQVIMVERKRRIGSPVQCAGLLSAAAERLVGGDSGVIVQRVAGMVTVYPDGARERLPAPGLIVDRGKLDRLLAGRAREAGVRILKGCRAVPQANGAAITTDSARRFDISAPVIIGADGPRSATGRMIGSENAHFVHAVQKTYPCDGSPGEAMFFFDKKLPGGYGWLFPAGDSVRAGVGIAPGSGISLRQALQYFIEKNAVKDLVEGPATEICGGPVPVGRLLNCHSGNVVLAGDAAGLCNAQTGAGLASALLSGELAGEAAAGAASGDGLARLSDYSEEIRELLGGVLEGAWRARRWLSGRKTSEREALSRDLRAAWPLSADYSRPAEEEVEISGA